MKPSNSSQRCSRAVQRCLVGMLCGAMFAGGAALAQQPVQPQPTQQGQAKKKGLRVIIGKPGESRPKRSRARDDLESKKPPLPPFQPDASGLTSRVSVNAPNTGDTEISTGRSLQHFEPTGPPPNLRPKTSSAAKKPAETAAKPSGKPSFNPKFGQPPFVPEDEPFKKAESGQNLHQFVPTGPPPPPDTPEPSNRQKTKAAKATKAKLTEKAEKNDPNAYYRTESPAPPLKFEPPAAPSMTNASGGGRTLSHFEPTGPPPKLRPEKPKARPKKTPDAPAGPKKMPDRFYQKSQFAPVTFEPEEMTEPAGADPAQTLTHFEPTGPPPAPEVEKPPKRRESVGRRKEALAENADLRREKLADHYHMEGQRALPKLEPDLGAPAIVDGEVVSGPTLTHFEPTGPPPKPPKVKPPKQPKVAKKTGPEPLPDRFYQQSKFAPVTFDPDAAEEREPAPTLTQFQPTGPPPPPEEPQQPAAAAPSRAELAEKARKRQEEVVAHYQTQSTRALPGLSEEEALILAAQQGEIVPGTRSLTHFEPTGPPPKQPKPPKKPRVEQTVASAGPKPLPDRFYSKSEFGPVKFQAEEMEPEEPGQSLRQFTPTGPPPPKPEPQTVKVAKVDPTKVAEERKKRRAEWNDYYVSGARRPLPGLEGIQSMPSGEIVDSNRALTQFTPAPGYRPPRPPRKTSEKAKKAAATQSEQPAGPKELPSRFYTRSGKDMPTLTPDEEQLKVTPPTLKKFEPTPVKPTR